jgi:glycosyltransferase involved in cell wall biosynthesis
MERGDANTKLNSEERAQRPLVSVVVPTYNYAHFIGQMFESLLAQTYNNWECIIVDDGSTDDTEQTVARLAERDPRIRYMRQRNQRQAVAKNTALDAARGRYVQFLDADDLIEPLKFERQVEFLESHPEVDIVYGGARFFHTEHPEERLHAMFGEDEPWMPEVSGSGKTLLLSLIRINILVINAALVRREAIDDVGPFDAVLPPVEDWDYWIRCALAGKRFEFRDFDGTLSLVRAHDLSTSRQHEAVLAAWRALRAKIDTLTNDPELLLLNREMKSQLEGSVGVQAVASGSRLSAARQFIRAGLICPRTKGRVKWLLCALGSPLLNERQLHALLRTTF